MQILITVALVIFAVVAGLISGSAIGPVAALTIAAALWIPNLLQRARTRTQPALSGGARQDASNPSWKAATAAATGETRSGTSLRDAPSSEGSRGREFEDRRRRERDAEEWRRRQDDEDRRRRDNEHAPAGSLSDPLNPLSPLYPTYPSLDDGGGRRRRDDDGAAAGASDGGRSAKADHDAGKTPSNDGDSGSTGPASSGSTSTPDVSSGGGSSCSSGSSCGGGGGD